MAQSSDGVRPLHIQIPVSLHDRLKAMAEARDRSVAAETRRAIESRLDDFEAEQEEAA